MKRELYTIVTVVLLITLSCTNSKKQQNTTSDPVEKLRTSLLSISGEYTLFGHQDALAYGVNWSSEYNQSDVKQLTGSHPSVFGWDIGHIGEENNIDKVPFDSIAAYIKLAHSQGGINTISWHTKNPANDSSSWDKMPGLVAKLLPGGQHHAQLNKKLDDVAEFLQSLRNDDGFIPVIFRPWHEMNGDWFWWGAQQCTPQEYIALFRHTIEYLTQVRGVKNILVAYSPDRMFDTAQEYLTWYPGDDMVDILGVDNYYDFSVNRLDLVVQRLSIVSDLARERNKIAAFTETGNDRIEIENWYTKNLLYTLNANEKTRRMAYVLVWRNANTEHFYVPYPDHHETKDFLNFVSDKQIVLLNEFNQLKQK